MSTVFVEIVRLFIVVAATAGGFTVAGGSTREGNGPVIGATLGALVGYVAGGVIGRLLNHAMGRVERDLERISAPQLLAGAFGATALGGLSALIAAPALFLIPGRWGWPPFGLVVWIGVYEGAVIAARRADNLLAMAGLSTRPLVRSTRYGDPDDAAVLLDTSAVLDGRLLAVAKAGFLSEPLLVPRFILDEIAAIAEAQDGTRSRRGRRGLESLDALRELPGVKVHVLDDEMVEHDDVAAKLVALARRLRTRLLTVDGNLQRVAELQGVQCLNLHRLATVLAPALVPGEVVRLPISREGKEPGQGVGFLDDGTMVVVVDAAPHVGEEVDVRITGNAQTSVGRMLFASLTD